MILRKNFKELGLPVGPYTHAVVHGNTLYTSGMTAFGTPSADKSFSEQVKEIFRQLAFIAKQQGCDLKNIIKVTLFVTDLGEIQEARQTLFDIYGDNIPASSLIHVNALFSSELKVEVEAIFGLTN